MKKHKLSPDAWVQLVKQLAFQKMYGRPGVTYESAQTRKFKKGRTEVIRSASNEASTWVRAMLDSSPSTRQDPTHLRTLFQRAVARHIQYSVWAADGQGVDRHLFGLKKSLQEGEEVPGIFKDEAYGKSSHWELSTSQLSSVYFDGWGYGEGGFSFIFFCFLGSGGLLDFFCGSCTRWVWFELFDWGRIYPMDHYESEEEYGRAETLPC